MTPHAVPLLYFFGLWFQHAADCWWYLTSGLSVHAMENLQAALWCLFVDVAAYHMSECFCLHHKGNLLHHLLRHIARTIALQQTVAVDSRGKQHCLQPNQQAMTTRRMNRLLPEAVPKHA